MYLLYTSKEVLILRINFVIVIVIVIVIVSILRKTLKVELEKLSIWLKANKLSLNAQQTYYLVFHRARDKMKN